MNATTTTHDQEPNEATADRRQTAKSTAPGGPRREPARPHILQFPGNCPPARSALLRLEMRLQDELDDTQQAIADAEESDSPSPFAWPAWRLCWIRTKIRLFGFRPPKPPSPLRPSSTDRLAERLHLRWARLIGTLLRWPPPIECNSQGSCAQTTTGLGADKEENR